MLQQLIKILKAKQNVLSVSCKAREPYALEIKRHSSVSRKRDRFFFSWLESKQVNQMYDYYKSFKLFWVKVVGFSISLIAQSIINVTICPPRAFAGISCCLLFGQLQMPYGEVSRYVQKPYGRAKKNDYRPERQHKPPQLSIENEVVSRQCS